MRYGALASLAVLVAVASGGARAAAPPCSASPWVRIELQAGGPLPASVTLEAGKELDVVNETDGPLTMTSGPLALSASLQPGECIAVVAGPGTYPYSVSGYPAGDATGWVYVTPAPLVTIAQHASVAYGQRTVLSGTASGPPGTPVVVSARPLNASQATEIGSVMPVRGTWTLSVGPKVGTEYTADFGDAEDQRVLRVIPGLVVRKTGHTITATVTARLVHPAVWLFHYTPNAAMLWTGFRSTTAGPKGIATFKRVPAGRYYVAVLGGELYLDNGSEPFNVRR
jgi:hypothetical protein